MTSPAVPLRTGPRPDPGTWLGRMRAPLLTALAGGSAVLALRLRDPHASGSWGFCPFKLLMGGVPCPGCGGLRAVNDLTHLELGAALSSNALAVAFGLVLIVAWIRWVPRRWRGQMVPMLAPGRTTTIALGVAVVGFGVFRLTPWGAWLQP